MMTPQQLRPHADSGSQHNMLACMHACRLLLLMLLLMGAHHAIPINATPKAYLLSSCLLVHRGCLPAC